MMHNVVHARRVQKRMYARERVCVCVHAFARACIGKRVHVIPSECGFILD